MLVPSSEESVIEERKLVSLLKFMCDCKANNILLVMCYSPYYGQSVPKSICMIEEMATKNDVMILNHGDNERFLKPKYFQNSSHLNDIGATEYSKAVARVLNF